MRAEKADGSPVLVSVVTPCLNPGPELERCLESVRRQTYTQIEHVVVDGASTDGTLDLLRAAEGIVWVSEPDDGQAQAINKGFARAGGEIVTWLCADDELLPDAVERAVAALASSGAQWVYGDCVIVEGDEAHLRRSQPQLSPELFGYGNPISQPGTFFRAAALGAVGPLDESLDLAFDYDLWLRFTTAGLASVYVPEPLARFAITPESKTGRHGWAPFLREEALALAKNGPPRHAAFRLGASAALDVRSTGPLSRKRLKAEIANRSALVPASCRLLLEASAFTEATFLELPTPLALRHLLIAAPWRVPETRGRITFRVRRRLRTLLTGRRPPPTFHPDPRYLVVDADRSARDVP
jgi:hypothetical protein